ncbi:MAG: hypothetical protein Q7S73_00095 [bacterium]|jgi:hypothetical protein|nr:hypothetical protein [bacterium]
MSLFERALGEHPERAKSRSEKQRRWSEIFETLRKFDRKEIDLDPEVKAKMEIKLKEIEKQIKD